MANKKLAAGELSVRLHYAKDLKDCDWFGKQDPYVKLSCGKVHYRSNTDIDGGRNPVWNQEFVFKVDQEAELELSLWDEDTAKIDDPIGKAKVDLVPVRSAKRADLQVPVIRRISRRQQGFIFVTLTFRPANEVPRVGGNPAPGTMAERQARADSSKRAATAAAAAAGSGASSDGCERVSTLVYDVPRYEPSCGLIEPLAHQRLPCHQGARTNCSAAVTARAPSCQTASSSGPAAAATAAPAYPYYQQPPTAPPTPPQVPSGAFSFSPGHAAPTAYPSISQPGYGQATAAGPHAPTGFGLGGLGRASYPVYPPMRTYDAGAAAGAPVPPGYGHAHAAYPPYPPSQPPPTAYAPPPYSAYGYPPQGAYY